MANSDGKSVNVTWTANGDETGGERDIVSYLIWRRPSGTTDWGPPFISVPAGNPPTYNFQRWFRSRQADTTTYWEYAIAAQDCTPSLFEPGRGHEFRHDARRSHDDHAPGG